MKNSREIEIIERGLKDSDWRVREAAMNACQGKNVFRTFDPPTLVYKKCFGGTIVAASIPGKAAVRGFPGVKCRASRAKIVDIIGTTFGEKVGISSYDKSTMYFIGDEIVIDDFDYSGAECAPGFHFFCTKEEAEAY